MKKIWLAWIIVGFSLTATAQETGEFIPSLKWKGDFRFRFQNEWTKNEDARLSQRLRLRAGLLGQIERDLLVEVRLATARSNSSTNQTLGDNKEPASQRRFIGLDLAYAQWTALSFLKATAGRIPQAHFRPGGSQILLDADLALEGLSLASDYAYDEFITVFANAGSVWLRENYDAYYSQEQSDNMLNWGQAGLKFKFSPGVLTAGMGFFNYTGVQGAKFSDLSTGGTSRGNSEEPVDFFKNPFSPRQYFLDFKGQEGDWKYGVFAEHLVNGETKDPNRAWWTGISAGQKNWSGQISYGEIQSDAVPAVFTDSDFAAGTVNSKGYLLTLQSKLSSKVGLSLSQYVNQRTVAFEGRDYSRTHLDLTAEF